MLLKAGYGIGTQETRPSYEVVREALREEITGKLKESVLYHL